MAHEISKDEIKALVGAVDYSEALTITAGEADVIRTCQDALRYGYRAVAAFPQFLPVMVKELQDSGIRALVPVAFPCGGNSTKVKCREAEEGLQNGASDVDMVMNIGAFKSGDYRRASDDIKAVMQIVKSFRVPFKVIIEIGVLSEDEIVTAAKLVRDSGADFVKTCTGFGPGRATIHAIRLIKEAVGESISVKASGGVAGLEDGVYLMRAGAAVVAQRGFFTQQLEKLSWPESNR